jgi:hypothetical protein
MGRNLLSILGLLGKSLRSRGSALQELDAGGAPAAAA